MMPHTGRWMPDMACRKHEIQNIPADGALRGQAGRGPSRAEGKYVTRRVSVASGLLAALVLLLFADHAHAWGPATHVKLASDLLSQCLWMVPTAVAAIISRHRRYFIYGNVATDTVFAKKMSRVKQVCHRWSTGMSLLQAAGTDEARAFAYGYLSHLAADTVAHNKFLPRQMALSRSTISFGHLYWEVRADARIDNRHWQRLRRSLRGRYPEPERLLESHLQRTLLSYKTNRILFRRMNLLASEEAWRRSVDFWERLSRYALDVSTVGSYHAESLGRMLDLLQKGEKSLVVHEDPNGNFALGYARAQRRQLRQMHRAGMSHDHVIAEAALCHAAVLNGAAATAPPAES